MVSFPTRATRRAYGILVGDAVAYLRDATMDAASGVGTGSIREHYTTLVESGARLFASRMSSKARVIDASAARDKAVEFAAPERLVELIAESKRIVTY